MEWFLVTTPMATNSLPLLTEPAGRRLSDRSKHLIWIKSKTTDWQYSCLIQNDFTVTLKWGGGDILFYCLGGYLFSSALWMRNCDFQAQSSKAYSASCKLVFLHILFGQNASVHQVTPSASSAQLCPHAPRNSIASYQLHLTYEKLKPAGLSKQPTYPLILRGFGLLPGSQATLLSAPRNECWK